MSIGQTGKSAGSPAGDIPPPLPFNARRVHGMAMLSSHTEAFIDMLTAWPVRPSDVYLVTYPKSGTTWTQRILQLARNGGADDGARVDHALPWIDGPQPSFDPRIQDLPSPRMYKSHLNHQMVPGGRMPVTESPAKYIYVARNPKDTAVSYFHHSRALKLLDFEGDWDCFFQHFCRGEAVFGDWFDHVLGWWKLRDAPNVLFLKYEDMKKDPHQAVQSIASFIGCNLEPQVVESIVEQSSFDAMKKKSEPLFKETVTPLLKDNSSFKFFRKGTIGDWKNYFTEDQNSQFDTIYSKRMEGTGLTFDF